MKPLYQIEQRFKEMCEKSPVNKNFYEKYIVFKNILFEEFYDLIRESKRGFTDHSHKHIENVLKKMNSLCLHKIDSDLYDDSDHIKLFELYLLLMSIIFHDVAMLVERRDRHSNIKKILNLFDSIILSGDEKEWILKIVKCHQSSKKIEKEIPHKEKMVLDFKIHPQFLASMLRLADELDESKSRANVIGLKTGSIPEGQKIYHEVANAFDGITPDHLTQTISIELSTQKKILFKKYKKGKAKKKVLFFDELLERLEKINKERKYCMGFNRYFIEYRSVNVKWFIKHGDSIIKEVEYTFDDNKDKKTFIKEKYKEFSRYKK